MAARKLGVELWLCTYISLLVYIPTCGHPLASRLAQMQSVGGIFSILFFLFPSQEHGPPLQ